MNEQKDILVHEVKIKKNEFETAARQRTIQIENNLDERMNQEGNQFRVELDTKVRGVREGIQRVFDERIKRERDVVDSRILTVRN